MSSINEDDIRDVERSRYRMLLSLLHMMNGPPQTETMEQVLNRLFQRGRSRGFLTEQEMIYIFPEIEDYLEVYRDRKNMHRYRKII